MISQRHIFLRREIYFLCDHFGKQKVCGKKSHIVGSKIFWDRFPNSLHHHKPSFGDEIVLLGFTKASQ